MNVYVGGDGKLHFVNSGGADSVLPFNPFKGYTLPDMIVRVPHNSESKMYFPLVSVKAFSFTEQGRSWCNANGDIIYEDGTRENLVPNVGDGTHPYSKTLAKKALYLEMTFRVNRNNYDAAGEAAILSFNASN